MKKYILPIIIAVFLLTSTITHSQIGGTRVFPVLDVKTSARVAALGGDFLPLKDRDITIAVTNPSLISKEIDNQVALNYTNQFIGTNYGLISYSKTFNHIGSFVGSFQHLSSGGFAGYDEYEKWEGNFTAADYALIVGWGRELDSNFSIGANLKTIYSQYEIYTSSALAVDVAANYHNQKHLLDVTFLAKNIGAQLSTFNGEREDLPFQMELGVSKKLSKAPIRLFASATHLEKWDLRYEDPLNPTVQVDVFTKDTIKKESSFGGFVDNLFRHTAFGIELSPSKYFCVRLGYNYKAFREMAVGDGFSFTGVTYGFGLRIKQFYLSYARGNYHSFGSPNYLSLIVDINSFFKGAASSTQSNTRNFN